MRTNAIAKDFLLKSGAMLAVVSMNPLGRPDSVSYWKNNRNPEAARLRKLRSHAYESGRLLDIWV
jgi:hypothetical protein